MADESKYLEELYKEKVELDKVGHTNASKLVSEEIKRVQEGKDPEKAKSKYLELTKEKALKLVEKILIPVKEFPKFNFVGKIIGPRGNTLKRLQEDTGTRIMILGKGSMRDKNKEEELRKESSSKYAHLNEDLHVMVEIFALPGEAHTRMGYALDEIKKYLTPDNNDEIRQEQLRELAAINGTLDAPPNMRGRGRGGPGQGMRGRGGMMGRGGMQGQRGGMAMRGQAQSGPRGQGFGSGRGGMGMGGGMGGRGGGMGGMGGGTGMRGGSSMGGGGSGMGGGMGMGGGGGGGMGGGTGFGGGMGMGGGQSGAQQYDNTGGAMNQQMADQESYGYDESYGNQSYGQSYDQSYGDTSGGNEGYYEDYSGTGGDNSGNYGSGFGGGNQGWGSGGTSTGGVSARGGPSRFKSPAMKHGVGRSHPYQF
ncbi:KH domain-containing, RNA-binding, signal transduction-associated protein 2-like [Ptychodera flava]|uniref:KH domain-containing, RNA-binding, signal transduction-associated protein 2-like n=1 Tax=Ptychodera flava TaxID=63121 RepID=UPI003969FAEC